MIADAVASLLKAASAALRPLGDPLATEPPAAEFEPMVRSFEFEAADLQAMDVAEPERLADVEETPPAQIDVIPAPVTEVRCETESPAPERIIPLTRKRLRRQETITWPSSFDGNPAGRPASERAALLREMQATSRPEFGLLLARAYDEEEDALRVAALRALLSGAYPEGRDVFRRALRSSSDIERTLAVEGLSQPASRCDLVPAFEDRIEAIAAKAALAYAGSRRRCDLVEALTAHVRPARAAAILAMLAGVLE